MAGSDGARYDRIGVGYARRREEEPRFAALVWAALGTASTVVNVGAGAGSYEPRDRWVLPVEPSDVMAAQRGPDRPPALRASAGALPLRDDAVDAAMAMVTVHHWDDELEAGVRELRRVASGPVVILTYDPAMSRSWWLPRDYLTEVASLDDEIFPSLSSLRSWLGGTVTVTEVPMPRDCVDRMMTAFWPHPEWVLDPAARAATSGFTRMPSAVIDRVVADVGRDLSSGAWDARNGELRALAELDVGLRLVVATP